MELSNNQLKKIYSLLEKIDCCSDVLKDESIRDLTVDIRSILDPIYCPVCGACGETGDGCASRCDGLSALQLFLNLEQYLLEKELLYFGKEASRPNIISHIIEELRIRSSSSDIGMYCDHYIKSYQDLEKENNDYYTNVKSLLHLFNKVEESDSGVEFHPNTISSCRVLDTITFGEIFKKLREMTQ